ncbi:MAG: segregation/condensation protein A [Lachnospiraceae bacterium]|nr:segregation/condensation protein A [Lachnospiraceae bacterium]
MSIEVKLSAFEGPLDLLLLLIEKNKVDIYDIPIVTITDQYMEYVNSLPGDDLDLLSDFLLLASTLLDIKARMLLPKEEDENGEEIDPRSELVERLIEYKEFKKISEELREIYGEEEQPFFRDPSFPEEVLRYRPPIDFDALFSGITGEELREAFRTVLLREREKVDPEKSRFGTIKKDPVRLADKVRLIKRISEKKGKFTFKELFEDAHTRSDVVVTFIACLELVRIGYLKVKQRKTFSDIRLEWDPDSEAELTNEDLMQYE